MTRTRNAAETRVRILAAARIRFSRDNYENVGTRDIAADAGVDAALVNRYFGGKEKLFAEVLEGGFLIAEHLPENLADFGSHLAAQIMQDAGEDDFAGLDALRVLLRAAGSPVTAALVSERFHAEFVMPLAKLLPGREAPVRAGLIAAYAIGLATMRHILHSPVLAARSRKSAVQLTGAAMQACVTAPA